MVKLRLPNPIKRLVNPMTPGQKVIIAGGVGLAAFFIGKEVMAKSAKGVKPDGCPTAPFKWNEATVRQQIEMVADTGETDRDIAAIAVASTLFSDYPKGGSVEYPPAPDAPKGVDCVWSRIVALVAKIWEERGIKPSKNPADIVQPLFEDPQAGGKPRAGSLFRVRSGWTYYGSKSDSIAYQALKAAGVPASGAGQGKANRIAYTRAINCSPYNDALSAVDKWDDPGKSGYPYNLPHKRAVALNATHHDNKTRLFSGQPARRSVIDENRKAHDGTGGSLPVIWLPRIQKNTETVIIVPNDDGTSGINPPARILAFGLENVPPGNYGCDPWRMDVDDFS